MEKKITVQGVEFTVTYFMTGFYIPASIDGPEENPEVEITNILVGGVDLADDFLGEWLVDKLYEEIESSYKEDATEASFDEPDDYWDDSMAGD